MIATMWEVFNDRYGDFNKSSDVWVRILLLWFEATIIHLITRGNILLLFNLSAAFYFLFFDYIISYVLIKNGTLEPPRGVKYHWWTYQAKAGVIDNLSFWKNLNPYVKLLIRVTYFVISIILYFTV